MAAPCGPSSRPAKCLHMPTHSLGTDSKTLTIKDLYVSPALDRKAIFAVRGGNADHPNGASQRDLQSVLAAANAGNGIIGGIGPIII